MNNNVDLGKMVNMMRELNIRKSQESLWAYCCLIGPDFYKTDRWHLWLICNTLQLLYERKLTKKTFWDLVHNQLVPAWYGDWYGEHVGWDSLNDDIIYTRLMMNLPPRHGKSRTIVNFCDWILGKNHDNKIITVSYNADLASDMSRYVRDGIMMKKVLPTQIIYNDIFPDTMLQKGNSSFMKWALEGCFFNYLGTGLEGTITGKGANCSIIDDPIKSAEESYNDKILNDIWNWYTGTFLSRSEKEGDGSIDIVNHTRWNTNDLCGRIMTSNMSKKWLTLSIPVECNEKMLCPGILPREDWEDLRDNMDPNIFRANYYQEPIDIKGRLFQTILTYDQLPDGIEKTISYTDTADTGEDWLCSIVGVVKEGEGYITDIYFTQEPMVKTEPKTAKFLHDNDVNDALIESNNGGKSFARNVEDEIWKQFHTRAINIRWQAHQTNKETRIKTGASFVMKHIFLPSNWDKRWPDFYVAINSYVVNGKNAHDDAPEALTEFGKMISGDDSITAYIEFMKRKKEKRDKKH
jgi:predicted phage terminase large subunit-like protein